MLFRFGQIPPGLATPDRPFACLRFSAAVCGFVLRRTYFSGECGFDLCAGIRTLAKRSDLPYGLCSGPLDRVGHHVCTHRAGFVLLPGMDRRNRLERSVVAVGRYCHFLLGGYFPDCFARWCDHGWPISVVWMLRF